MMTLKEAIAHAEEKARGCGECAEEHRQLAEWLKIVGRLEQSDVEKLAIKCACDSCWGVSKGCSCGILEVVIEIIKFALADIRGERGD